MLESLSLASAIWVAVGGATFAVVLLVVWLMRRSDDKPAETRANPALPAEPEAMGKDHVARPVGRDKWIDSSEIQIAGAEDEEDLQERSSTVPMDGQLVALSAQYLKSASLQRKPIDDKAVEDDPAERDAAPAVAPDIEIHQHPSVSQTA